MKKDEYGNLIANCGLVVASIVTVMLMAAEPIETIEVPVEPIPEVTIEQIHLDIEGAMEEEQIIETSLMDEVMDVMTPTYEWYSLYKDACNFVEDPPETIYDVYTAEEIELMCYTVYRETRDCSFEAQAHVAEVILNRVESDLFPNNIKSVLLQPNQFSTGSIKYDEQTRAAVEFAFCMPDETNGALFFQVAKQNSWGGYKHLFNDGYHSFYG